MPAPPAPHRPAGRPNRPTPVTPWLAAFLLLTFGPGLAAQPPAAPASGPPAARETEIDAGQPDESPADQAAERDELDAWIEQLGADDFYVRQNAAQHIGQLGVAAYDRLAELRHSADIELRLQAEALLDRLRIRSGQPDDPPEVQRLLQAFADRPQEQRLQVIRRLGEFPAPVGMQVLARIVRVDPSPIVSKMAALQILDYSTGDPPLPAEQLDRLRQALGNSQRPATTWLHLLLLDPRSPDERLRVWQQQLEHEHQLLLAGGDQTSSDVFSQLVRWYMRQLKSGNHMDEALAVAERYLMSLTHPADELRELAEVFIERQAWEEMDKNFERFESIFRGDARLMYRYAEALQKQGRASEADELVSQLLAQAKRPPYDHLAAAVDLGERGMHAWAEGEFRQSIAKAGYEDPIAMNAAILLAEMLHDQGKHLEAAEALQPLYDLQEKSPAFMESLRTGLQRERINSVFSRMHYFYAEHYRRAGDRQKQIEHLAQGTQHDPTDADLLIGRWRVTDPEPQWKEETRTLITRAVEDFRLRIDQAQRQLQNLPDPAAQEEIKMYLASLYNQLAWLVSNTEGDFQEALQCSQRSLELDPNRAGYLDTLARCYFAVGDLSQAIENQKRALELDPHSGQLQRQLEEFQQAAATAEGGSR